MGGSESKVSSSTNQSGNHGIVINNYYSNHYQNSIDLSGHSSGVGDEATGNTPNPFSSLTDSLGNLALMGTMLLDPDTENTTNMSDRVLTKSLANTAINSQSSVGVLRAYKSNHKNKPPTSCTDQPTMATQSTERYFTRPLWDINWSKSQAVYDYFKISTYDLMRGFGGLVEQNMDNHSYMKCGWRVQVQINASSFHSGSMGIFMVPEAVFSVANEKKRWLQFNTDFRQGLNKTAISPEQLFHCPHQVLNLRTNTNCSIDVPYVNCTPTSYLEVHCPWSLVCMVLTPLNYTSGAAPNIGIAISAAPTDPIWNGLRHSPMRDQSPIPVTVRENAQMFTSTGPDTNVPIYGNTVNPSRDKTGKIDDILQVCRLPTPVNLSTTNSFRPYFTYSDAVISTDQPLMQLDLSLPGRHLVRTGLSQLSRLFTQFRGSLNIHFMFTGSAMCRGKLMLVYTPPGAGPPRTPEQAALGTYVTWDLGLQSTYEFTIPFISGTDYKVISTPNSSTLQLDGFVSVFALTSLTYPPNTPTSGDVMVFISAGEDFSLKNPVGSLVMQGTDNLETGATSSDATTVDFTGTKLEVNKRHTDVEFFFDRSFFIGFGISTNLAGTNLDNNNCLVTLTLTDFALGLNRDGLVWSQQRNISPVSFLAACFFTYFHCDVEVTIIPTLDADQDYRVYYYPVGSPLPKQDSFLRFADANNKGFNVGNFIASATPMTRSPAGHVASFTIPYSSPLSSLPVHFDGYAQLSGKGSYGTAPGNSFGTLLIVEETTQNVAGKYSIYLRPKNMECFCPRPMLPFQVPNHNTERGKVRTTEGEPREDQKAAPRLAIHDEVDHSDILLGGDIEENPGPVLSKFAVLRFQGPSPTLEDEGPKTFKLLKELFKNKNKLNDADLEQLDKIIDEEENKPKKAKKKAKTHDEKENIDLSAFTEFLEADDPVETAAKGWKALRELQSVWEFTKGLLGSVDFWYTFILQITGAVVGYSLFMHALDTGDAKTIFLATMTSFVTVLSLTKVKNFFVENLSKILKTKPPDLKETKEDKDFFGLFKKIKNFGKMNDEAPSFLSDTNAGFTLARHIEWAVNLIRRVYKWIMDWISKEEESDEAKIPHLMRELPNHVKVIETDRNGFGSGDPEPSYQFVEELYELAVKCGKPAIAAFVERYRKRKVVNSARTEPVVLVVRGLPGTGKSIVTQLLAQSVSKNFTGKQSVYSLPPDPKHFDGYCRQFSVLLDDLGQNPDGEDFKLFCQMISTNQLVCPMAALPDKGITFSSLFIACSTNLPRFNPVTVSDTNALSRRIFLDLTARPGRMAETNGRLDLEKALEVTGPSPRPDLFRNDCPILHKMGLELVNNRTKQEMSLLEVHDMICNEIIRKQNILLDLNKLVFEGPTVDDDEQPSTSTQELHDPIFDPLPDSKIFKAEDPTLRDVAKELVIIKTSLAQVISLKENMVKAGIIFTVVSSLLLLFFKLRRGMEDPVRVPRTKEDEEEKEEKAAVLKFITPGEEEAAYEQVKKKPLVKKTLELQAPTLDFEKFVLNHVSTTFTFHSGGKALSQTCLTPVDRLIVVNAHTWERVEDTFEVKGVKYHRESCKYVQLTKDDKDTDAVFVLLPNGPLFKNSVNKFIASNQTFPIRGTAVTGLNANGPLMYSGNIITGPSQHETESGEKSLMFLYRATTKYGFCGSPITGPVGGNTRILGMHSAGTCGVAGGTLITQEMIKLALNHLKKKDTMKDEGAITEIDDGPRTHISRKSKLKKTMAHSVFKPEYAPAALSKKDKRLNEGVDLDKQVFTKHTGNTEKYPEEFVWAAREYANELFTHLGKDFGIMSSEAAIKGIDHLDAMDPRTSPGLPYTLHGERRTDHIDFETGAVSQELGDKIEHMLKTGEIDIEYQTFLKDEVRPIEKVKRGGTRTVDVPPVEHVILGRMLLGKFCAAFHANNGTTIGSAVGCDPDVDWTRFATEFSECENVYDIDYSAFDSSHGTGMFELVANEIFTPKNGFHPRVRDYLMSLAVSTHAYEEKRYLIEGGLPSGCSCTTVLNTVMNNIIIRAALKMTYKNFDSKDITVLAYGDDLLVGTDYDLDFNKVKEKLLTVGYTITPATKEGNFPLQSSILDVQFLKRKFEPYIIHGFIFRPVMSEKNLEAILSFYKPGTLIEKLQSVAQLAVHCGIDTYDRLFQPFRDAGLPVPTWWSMEEKWESNFMGWTT
nr:MAG: polyprotein [Ailurivirus D]